MFKYLIRIYVKANIFFQLLVRKRILVYSIHVCSLYLHQIVVFNKDNSINWNKNLYVWIYLFLIKNKIRRELKEYFT